MGRTDAADHSSAGRVITHLLRHHRPATAATVGRSKYAGLALEISGKVRTLPGIQSR